MIDLTKLLADIEQDEGFSPTVYKDSQGFATVGFGIRTPLTLAEARVLTGGRLAVTEAAISTKWPWFMTLNEPRQRALSEMGYNLGVEGLGKFKRMLSFMEAGDFTFAAEEALASVWARQVGARARRIADLIRKG